MEGETKILNITGTYIYRRPEYFAYKLDQISNFNGRVDHLDQFAKYTQ